MPDISLLQPMVLRGVVEKFVTPETLTMLARLDQTPWPYPSATWDVIKGSRMIATPNVPNSEAHVVSRLGRQQEAAAFIYLREKKVFQPTTIRWLREPGQIASINAERAVLREINDLNIRFDNFAEWSIWQALTGSLSYNYPDVQATINYGFPASHLISASTPWAVGSTGLNTVSAQVGTTAGRATPIQIIEQVRSWKRIVQIHGRVPARECFATSVTMAALMESWVSATTAATVSIPATMLSDRMKDQYYSSGIIDGFMGLTWTQIEQVYEDVTGNLQFYVPDAVLYMGNYTDQRPIELLVGPTADDEAPNGFTGKYAKTWKEKDPSARQYLLEWNLLPVITRPEQMVYVTGLVT
jgi:Phage major capsid protein E